MSAPANAPSNATTQPHFNTPLPSPVAPPTAYTPIPPNFPQQQGQATHNNQNFMTGMPIQHNHFAQLSHQQNMMHHHMYNQMMTHQQQLMHHHQQQQHHQRYSSNGYGMSGGNYPQHICGHFASMHLPPSAYQLPCPSCQSRSLGGDNPYSQNQNNSWHMGSMNQHYPSMHPQHSLNHQMAGTANPSYPSYMSPHYTNMNGGGSFSQTARDIQCGDVSQSSQSKPKTSSTSNQQPTSTTNSSAPSGKPKSQKEQNNEKLSTKSNNQSSSATNATRSPTNSKSDKTKIKSPARGTENKDDCNNSYMKQDTYQRTLEYVQQCQNWNTTVIKEEVSSTTTDQKPNLNPNGTVAGYVPPATSAVAGVGAVPVATSLTTVELSQHPTTTTSTTSTLLPSNIDTGEFLAPLTPMTEVPNMVLNNLSSSLNSLQQENKYFQLLQ